ncbi:MAG: glycosyltransferase family 2 protein [Nitrospirota bacterium]
MKKTSPEMNEQSDTSAMMQSWMNRAVPRLLRFVGVRRRLEFSLHPLDQLVPDDRTASGWYSSGDAPVFGLTPQHGRYPTGWVHMTSIVKRTGADLTARLLVDSGTERVEWATIAIPVTLKGKINHVFKLPRQVRGLRWSPMQSGGEIVQDPVVITEISRLERIIRMASWVALDLWKMKKASQAKHHGLSVTRLLFDLQGAYDASAEMRINLLRPNSYESFIQRYDTVRTADENAMLEHINDMRTRPRISVILPNCNAPQWLVVRAIESLRKQLYPYWQLLIPIDTTIQPAVHQVLVSYEQADARIKLIYRSRETRLLSACNSALAAASGDYIALLDNRDLLAVNALYQVAVEINKHPEADLVYSDEDKIDESGRRHDPYFKCDWNPDLFYSSNYIGKLSVYRKSIADKLDGFRDGFGDDLLYDLALRFIQHIPAAHIHHVPFVLYHCGVFKDSSNVDVATEGCKSSNSIPALQHHFRDLPGVEVEQGAIPGSYRVKYPLPGNPPKVSLLIPTRDGREMLRKCIDSIRSKTSYPNWEIIVLNNRSRDQQTWDYFNELAMDPRIRVLNCNFPFNYSAINNVGARSASGDILALLNNDVEVINSDWLREMVSHAIRPEIGAVGAKLLYPDGTVQHAGVVVGLGGLAGHVSRLIPGDHPGYAGRAVLVQNYSALTAACLVVRRQLFETVGGLDENNLPVAYNDIDLCLKLQAAGYRNVWTPYAKLYHHESYSRGSDHDDPVKRSRLNAEMKYMLRRWHTATVEDPCYSPNLTIHKEDYSIATIPRTKKPWRIYLTKRGVLACRPGRTIVKAQASSI